jgi:glycosyltransferase involved in cell wall biosynthesis
VSPGVLYISYDGMLEPLGQSQVLAYLEKLAPGRRIHLVSFEKPGDWRQLRARDAIAKRIAAAGIRWHPMRYHKSPSAPATAYDIAAGSIAVVALAARHQLSVVHARSYIPGLMALAVKRIRGAAFLFDMRGLWADERVDGGLWPAGGRLFRAAKNAERRLLLAADHVVALTHASEAEIRRFPYLAQRMPPISVIPTCADLERFTISGPLNRDPFVLGYVGSAGTWYMLDEMLRCFLHLREKKPDARLLIVNRNDHGLIRARAAAQSIRPAAMELVAAAHGEVPALIVRMTAAMALYKPVYSRVACAPTKLAEYLGCGVPVLGNAAVGDVAEVLEERRVGLALRGFSDAELRKGIDGVVKLTEQSGVQERCRQAAVDLFSLERGVAAYDAIYRGLDRPGAGKRVQ